MTIRIINGTFGYNDGIRIKPLTAKDGDIDLPKALEKRLVEDDKIAVYVDKKPEENKPTEVFELGDRKVEDLEYKELQSAFKFYGLGNPVSKSKDFLANAIQEYLDAKGGGESSDGKSDEETEGGESTETTEVGEQNGDNLIPSGTEDGEKTEDDSEEDAEGESDDDSEENGEDAPNLNGVDGVAD